MDLDPDITKLGVELAGLAARKSAASIATRVRAAKQKADHGEQVNELSDMINELVEERGHLIAIAQAYREELESRRLSDSDLTYVTTEIVPVIKQIAIRATSSYSEAEEVIEIAEALLTEETLTIMQMLGFDYREALGRPLTDLARLHILNQAPGPDKTAAAIESQLLAQKGELALLEIAKDPDAYARYEAIRNAD